MLHTRLNLGKHKGAWESKKYNIQSIESTMGEEEFVLHEGIGNPGYTLFLI